MSARGFIRSVVLLLLTLSAGGCSPYAQPEAMQTRSFDVEPTLPENHYKRLAGQGYVPDAETAIAVARAVWQPIYGDRSSFAPFEATLENGVWHVHGTLPPRTVGGVPHAKIARSDGRVLDAYHTQ